MSVNFYFIRHAESTSNVDKRNLIGGNNWEVKLTSLGVKQAIALGKKFLKERVKFTEIYTSSAVRAKETARISLEILGYSGPRSETSRLLEQTQGGWNGKSKDIYKRLDVRKALDRDNWNYVPGDNIPGESSKMVADRMIFWLKEVLKNYSTDPNIHNIAVYSHGLAIKFMLAELADLDRKTA